MTRLIVSLAALILLTHAAVAGLSPAQLAGVDAKTPAGARLDLNLTAPDTTGAIRSLRDILAGRPAFLVFVDYTCNGLCGTALQLLSAALQSAALDPATYRMVVFGIDPKDSAVSATTMEQQEIPAALLPVTVFLLPDEATIQRATHRLGFQYAYDAVHDQFAHPAAVYVITPDGAVREVLSPFALTTVDIAGLIKDSAPPPLSLYQRIHLLCYGYAPANGIYTTQIEQLLKVAAVLTMLVLGGAVLLLTRRGQKAR
jgi:protein SCO1/2